MHLADGRTLTDAQWYGDHRSRLFTAARRAGASTEPPEGAVAAQQLREALADTARD
ncbi:hypothetical protein ACIQC7_34760 [Kitasatospora sp. NPDC088556]|uniref:hypothetical protein n=1 Tax=Kitasatospora sp. NPDC088556 TaxID=3364076 RepID=UPI0037F11054